MVQDPVLFKQVKDSGYRPAGQGVSSVGGAVVSRLQGSGGRLFIQHKGSHRDTAAQGLGAGHNIRLYPVLLPGKISAGAAHAALYLVQNQQNVPVPTKRLHPF